MFRIRYSKVRVRISELHTQETAVPSWEVPILEAVHGGAVTQLEDVFVDREHAPEASDEFRRLENRYRNTVNDDGSRGLPYVVSVYGQFGIGVQALHNAMQPSVEHIEDSVADLLGYQVSSVGG